MPVVGAKNGLALMALAQRRDFGILDFSKLEAGQVEITPSPVYLKP